MGRSRSLFFMILFSTCLLLTGCGVSKPVSSEDNPSLRCKKLNTDYYKSDSKFWNMAYREIPTVTYEEATGGDYRGTYVCIDAVAISGKELKSGIDSWKEVSVELGIPKEDGSYYSYRNSIVMAENYMFKYGFDTLCQLKEGDRIKLCLYLKTDSLKEAYAVGVKNIGKMQDFDINQYKLDAESQEYSEEVERKQREEEKARESEEKLEIQADTALPSRNYDSLQSIFASLTKESTEAELLEMIADTDLYYTSQNYNGSPRSIEYGIAFTEGAAKQKYAEAGDHLDVSFNATDGSFMYATYSKEGSSRIALFYNYGVYWDFREDAPGKYSGYYYYKAGDTSETGITIEYANGYKKKTAYHLVGSADRALP